MVNRGRRNSPGENNGAIHSFIHSLSGLRPPASTAPRSHCIIDRLSAFRLPPRFSFAHFLHVFGSPSRNPVGNATVILPYRSSSTAFYSWENVLWLLTVADESVAYFLLQLCAGNKTLFCQSLPSVNTMRTERIQILSVQNWILIPMSAYSGLVLSS